MSKAWVLMTALPPTKGHLHLIQFASRLGDTAEVIVCTQPTEPFAFERVAAIQAATHNMNVNVYHLHRQVPQNPKTPGFWEMWKDYMTMFGLQPDDYIVSSEIYGKKLADITGAKFMPYDPARSIDYIRATDIRNDAWSGFSRMIPEFQRYLRQTVTIFGAESTGKTTLTKRLSQTHGGIWLFEWARPYLENVKNEITDETMTAIWYGQRALQEHVKEFADTNYVFQDTDLFSTVGYWDFWTGKTPAELVNDATRLKSDLYLITKSNIPFEQDPLRYGGDHRESKDEFWIDLCERHGLNYRVLTSDTIEGRVKEAHEHLYFHWKENVTDKLSFARDYND